MDVCKTENDVDGKGDEQTVAEISPAEDEYLAKLKAEREQLDPSLTIAAQLLDLEIARIQSGQDKDKYIELHHDKPMKMSVKVRVPVKEFPKFNFVGKILGPKGNSLKRIQEETGTRMAVFGRGSMRDKEKEEECRREGGKYAHLNEDLHVNVEVFAHPIDCYGRMANALFKLRQHLVPDYNDEITQSQLQEMRYLNGETSSPSLRGRGADGDYHCPPRGRGGVHRGGYGANMPFGRGAIPSVRPQLPASSSGNNFTESNSHRPYRQ